MAHAWSSIQKGPLVLYFPTLALLQLMPTCPLITSLFLSLMSAIKMPLNVDQWSANIMLFYTSRLWCKSQSLPSQARRNSHHHQWNRSSSHIPFLLTVCLMVIPLLLLVSGDIESNPGPQGMYITIKSDNHSFNCTCPLSITTLFAIGEFG